MAYYGTLNFNLLADHQSVVGGPLVELMNSQAF